MLKHMHICTQTAYGIKSMAFKVVRTCNEQIINSINNPCVHAELLTFGCDVSEVHVTDVRTSILKQDAYTNMNTKSGSEQGTVTS
jgi:hypothetical protein